MSKNFAIKKCKAKTSLGFEIAIEAGLYAVTGDETDTGVVKLQGANVYQVKYSEFQRLKQQNLAVLE